MKKSFLSYVGGKSLLANKIIPKIPAHECYCEVFAGAAWLFFKKEESEIEIINDINTDLVTLYRIVKLHLDEFIRYFRWILISREEFDRFRMERPETLTDIQRAVRFYYLLKCGFSSKIVAPTFGVSATRAPRINLLRIEEELSEAHLRLSRAYIENLPYAKLIERVDRAGTFFYIDPPYFNCEDYYGKGIFSKEDFGTLRDLLGRIKGKFILSLNDTSQVREIYKRFRIESVSTSYSLGGGNKKKAVKEVLIRNF
ncbi:MAG: DNA adenine methylase [Nitrospirae bacterium]|nr:DNA adenine methylase [Nitrospirota bacterium]